MNKKQESYEKVFITIKEENPFDASLTEAIKETMDPFENHQAHSLTTAEVKTEFQGSPDEEVFLNYIHDVPESQSSDVKASLLGNLQDLNVIKHEVIEPEYVVPKAELLIESMDLPSIKSDVGFLDECSTSNNPQYILGEHGYDALKKKLNFYKISILFFLESSMYPSATAVGRQLPWHFSAMISPPADKQRKQCPVYKLQPDYSSSNSRLKQFNANFWKLWQACEFCGHFYNKFNYLGHYFIHFVKTNATNLLNCKTNKPSTLKNHGKSNEWKTRSKYYVRNRFVAKNSTAYTGQEAFKSEICFKEFTRINKLKVHLKTRTGEKPYKCDICLKQFKHKFTLDCHLRIHTGDKLFKCKTCLKHFTQKKNLDRHFNIHTGEKPYKCNICSKQFSQKSHLNSHFKIHTGEKSFKCKTCLKQFALKGNLNRHIKIHTGEKPYKCNICSKQYTQTTGLKDHIKFHTGEKPFKCKTCLKQFAKKNYLNIHLKTHTGEKPFKCKTCSNQFSKKSNLNRHIKIHSGEKPYKCNICSKQYTQTTGLKNYIKFHTGEKPFKCKICSKQFAKKIS